MYSQQQEEGFILKSVEGIANGSFFELGAFDGQTYSNTLALVERGWSGVMVEAGLHAFIKLLERHGGNIKIKLVHGAVGVTSGISTFWNCPTSFSTTEASNRDKFIHEGFSHMFYVPTISLDKLIFGLMASIDFLSIDTEGTSMDLFKAFLAAGFCRPRCICVEHDGRREEVLGIAEMNGYRSLYINEENLVCEDAA